MKKKLIDISDRDLPENSQFGFFFSFIFLMVGVYLKYLNFIFASYLFFFFTVICLIISYKKPEFLYPFNKLWMQFGFLIGIVVSPIILGFIFFGLLTPMGLIMRLFGRDELNLHVKKNQSHWKTYSPVNEGSESFKNQF